MNVGTAIKSLVAGLALAFFAGGVPAGTVVGVPQGGSGISSCTAYAVITGGTTSTGGFQCLASLGSSGYVLTSNGAGALPSFQALAAVTSVAVTVPSGFSISGSPITSTGTLAITFATGQTANRFLATPDGTTGALSLRAIVAGDIPTLNQNTSGSAATLTTPRAIYGNNFDGSAALTQIIASTYGGTGNGFAKFSGPASSEKTFTLPNASATILTDNTPVTSAQGGTGLSALGTGVATFLGTPSSANLAAAITNETGSGALCFATAPTLTSPALTSQTLPVTSTSAWDLSSGTMGVATLVNSISTLTITNLPAAGSVSFYLKQTSAGSYTIAWPSTVFWAGGTAPTLTTTTGHQDLVTCVIPDGTNLVCSAALDVHH